MSIHQKLVTLSKSTDNYVSTVAKMYISQMNTASNDMIKKEVESWIEQNS